MSSNIECSICLEVVNDPVSTFCGHIFCWSCLYVWIKNKDNMKCPSCNASVCLSQIIPIYLKEEYTKKKNEKDIELINLPPKPRPNFKANNINKYGTSTDFTSHYLFNTHNGKKLAGMGWFPCLFILLFSRQADPYLNLSDVNAPELKYYRRLKLFMYLLIIITICFIIYF